MPFRWQVVTRHLINFDFFCFEFISKLYTYQWYALFIIPGAWWGGGGNCHFLKEQASIPGAQSCIQSPYLPYKYLGCAQCVTGRYIGICGIHKEIPKTLDQQQRT